MDFAGTTQNIISLCTGMRGLERGLEGAGVDVRTLCYVEIEAWICWNLVRQMEKGVLDPAPVWTDLKTFPAGQFHGLVHGITGGYPCQPFSLAGERKGKDDPRHLWPHIQRIIEAVNPLWCFFENVGGHLSLGFDNVYKSLADMGYSVEAGLFTAAEVGAPQERERLFILAYAQSRAGRLSECEQGQERRFAGQGVDVEGCNKTMADTDGQQQYGCGDSRGGRSELADSNRQLADAGGEGLQGSKCGRLPEYMATRFGSASKRRPAFGSDHRWPARPGEDQYEYEESRTEPRLGYAVDGYNHYEDLLRLAGNAVVSQSAAKAWVELWKKITNS